MKSNETIHVFQEHGVRHTERREAVYGALRRTKRHPNAEELRGMVLGEGCDLSTATIYNTLDLFCRAGLVRRMSVAGGPDRFDADITDHIHLRVEDTGEIVDVPPELAEQLMRSVDPELLGRIEERMGVHIEEVGLHLVGRREA